MSARVLIDTTVWIDFFNGNPGEHVAHLDRLILARDDLCVCGLIITEVLQGIGSDKQFEKVRSHMTSLISLPLLDAHYLAAAETYRTLRKRGVTIRKPIDCLIASIAIDAQVPLLHNDRDFTHIAAHMPLRIHSVP